MKKAVIIIVLILLAVAAWLFYVKGYVGIRKRNAVPASLINEARIPGMKDIRLVADTLRARRLTLKQLIKSSGLAYPAFNNKEINILAISGGGANGAYGAGVLCGWTETDDRPEFDVVTGVSTGALIAPAAFLGPKYDNVIREIYTSISDADIMQQNLVQFVFGNRPSFLDTQPLRHLLNRTVTGEVIDGVAAAHKKGRRLYIATTNLDAKKLVIWDMGAIAAAGTPQSVELFRNVMLASASIPVAFPPVMITVEAGGQLYDEMHVDGSVTTQIVGSLLVLTYDEVRRKKTNVYIIRNGKIADTPDEVRYKVWDIAGAAFSTFMTWQSYGDIYRFTSLAKYERLNLFFSCIPYEFNEPRKSEFDLSYMRKLFYRGYSVSRSGKQWLRRLNSQVFRGM